MNNMSNMSNSGLALLIAPMLPTILLSFSTVKNFSGVIYLCVVIYSFYLAFYLIMMNLIEESKESDKTVEKKETDID